MGWDGMEGALNPQINSCATSPTLRRSCIASGDGAHVSALKSNPFRIELKYYLCEADMGVLQNPGLRALRHFHTGTVECA